MNLKRYLLETTTLVGAAALCAVVSNQSASRERRLALPGNYENATTVPARPSPDPPATSAAPPPSDTRAEARTDPNAAASASPVSEGISRTLSDAPAAHPSRPSGPVATRPVIAAAPAPEPLAKRFPPHPDKPFVEATGDDVAWLQAHDALVLDARRTSVFSEGHIAGARPFSVWEADIDEKVMTLLNEGRNQQEPIVAYCAGGDCEDSHMLAQKLFGAGFDNVLVYRDGWPDWQKRGGPSRNGSAR
jgi:rhodanese-related sulfurtransferase